MTDTLTVRIPDAVRDNSETVTDYAFMRHRSPDRGIATPTERDWSITVALRYLPGYRHYQWHDTNQRTGQRCRFDMIVRPDGTVTDLFHTEYFTRVACATGGFCHSYASYYALVIKDGEPTTDDPLPYCDEHTNRLIGPGSPRPDSTYLRHNGTTIHLSERLHIGQH